MKNRIGIFDSGIGGTTTLKEIINILPNEDYIYYSDTKNNPYGSKSDEELYKIVSSIVKKLLKKKVKIIVIACNTATTKCIKRLREEFKDIMFVGTEPAIKVACDKNYKNTLILATPGTISSDRTKQLIQDNKKDFENLYLVSCDKLANAIERNDKKEIKEILDNYLIPYQEKNIDAIVLGCTHYPLVKDEIQQYFKNAEIIDGNKGVAKRVKYLLETNNLENKDGKSDVEFIKTK